MVSLDDLHLDPGMHHSVCGFIRLNWGVLVLDGPTISSDGISSQVGRIDESVSASIIVTYLRITRRIEAYKH